MKKNKIKLYGVGQVLSIKDGNPGRITPQVGKASYATYRVDNAKPSSTTHEQASVNPLLKKNNGEAFQHPPYVRTTCDLHDCEHKLCKQICGTPVEDADAGHSTHSSTYPGVVYISGTDSSNQPRPEYMVTYESPIENITAGVNIDITKTANFNNNHEARQNVHMNTSRKPTEKAFKGSDDTTSIN